MSLDTLLAYTVTVVRMGEVSDDEYGNVISAELSREDYPAWVEPMTGQGRGGGKEETQDRDTQIEDWLLILPANTPITGRDRVEHDGNTFEVIGPPAIRRSPRGVHHVEARIRHIEGA